MMKGGVSCSSTYPEFWVGRELDVRIMELCDISYPIENPVGRGPAKTGRVCFWLSGDVVSREIEDEFLRPIRESFPIKNQCMEDLCLRQWEEKPASKPLWCP